MATAVGLFQVVQNEKLSERISYQLLQSIASGHYRPGDMLPPERDLSIAFQVSRVAVREALGSLGAKGILSVRQGRGTTVNPVEMWNTLDPEVLMLLQGDKVFDKLIEMRRILEPELAALAAANITTEEIEEMRLISDLPETDTMEQHVEHDTAFHVSIARATHNPVLLIVFSSISDLLRESRRLTFSVPGAIAEAHHWHQEIFNAIEKHDAEAARQAMAAHLGQVKNALHHNVQSS